MIVDVRVGDLVRFNSGRLTGIQTKILEIVDDGRAFHLRIEPVMGIAWTKSDRLDLVGRAGGCFGPEPMFNFRCHTDPLIEEALKEVDVEKEVAVINAGFDALRKLNEKGLLAQVEVNRFGSIWRSVESAARNAVRWKFRASKSAPWTMSKIEAHASRKKDGYAVSKYAQPYTVRMTGKFLEVGCQSFPARALRDALNRMIDGGRAETIESQRLYPNRRGVWCAEHVISWDQIEKLCSELSKVLPAATPASESKGCHPGDADDE